MAKYRPKDWEKKRLLARPGMSSREMFAFEDGVDTMLDVLKVELIYIKELIANNQIDDAIKYISHLTSNEEIK